MIVVATWPVLLRVQAWLGGRRSLAVAVMTTILLLILVVPLYFGVSAIVENTDQIAEWSKSLAALAVPAASRLARDDPAGRPQARGTGGSNCGRPVAAICWCAWRRTDRRSSAGSSVRWAASACCSSSSCSR